MSPAEQSASPPAGEGAQFQPFRTIAGDPGCGLLLICDHAENALPEAYGSLGLSPSDLRRHIAFDPGAGAVTEGLARRLGAPAVLARFSRLLIDPNRGVDDPTLIMRLSDGSLVPGNAAIDAHERARRIRNYYSPYHEAVAGAVAGGLASGTPPAIFSVHSFTPVWKGTPRSWHAGVLWDNDPRLPLPLLAALRAEAGLIVGDNEPYAGGLANDTVNRHATGIGLANALIEIRQDLIADAAGVEAWTGRLAPILAEINRDPALHVLRVHGSRADQPAFAPGSGKRG